MEKIAIFRWEDAAGKTNWREGESLPNTLRGTICGLFIHENEMVISVGLERFDDGGWRETITVPKRVVLGDIKYFTIPQGMRVNTDKE